MCLKSKMYANQPMHEELRVTKDVYGAVFKYFLSFFQVKIVHSSFLTDFCIIIKFLLY